MEKNKVDFWIILIVFGALVILIWALLKALEIIHSPVWIEMVPYFGIGASILGAAYAFGKLMAGIEQTDKKVDKLLSIGERFGKVEHEHNLVMVEKLKVSH